MECLKSNPENIRDFEEIKGQNNKRLNPYGLDIVHYSKHQSLVAKHQFILICVRILLNGKKIN